MAILRFNKSKVGDYASHNLSLYYGECPHGCRKKYCYIDRLYRRYFWASGPLRTNPKAYNQCKYALFDDVQCLIIQFSCDPLPISRSREESKNRLRFLVKHLKMLEKRGVPTKVLTKNSFIRFLPKLVKPFQHIEIGMSITTDSDNWKQTQYWEKGLSSINRRLDALTHLSNLGFKTWVSMEPILPLTDIRKAILEITDTGIKELWVGKGSYVKSLETAFPWGSVARQITDLDLPQVHLKEGLRKHLNSKKSKPYQTTLEKGVV